MEVRLIEGLERADILKIPAPLACYWLSQLELRKVGGPKDRAE